MESSDQLLIYRQVGHAFSKAMTLPMHLRFVVITKAKSPAIQTFPVTVDQAQLDRVTATVREVWTAMQAANYYANPSPMNCTTCGFKDRCPAQGGSSE